MTGIEILIGIMFLILVISTFVALFLYFNEPETKSNLPLVLNFMQGYNEGISVGYEKNILSNCQDGKSVRTVIPAIKNKKTGYAPQKLIVGKNKVLVIPQGDFDEEKTVKIYLPQTNQQLKDGIKNDSKLKKAFSILVEGLNEKNEQEDILMKRLQSQNKFLNKTVGGEIYDEALTSLAGAVKDISKLNKEARGDKDKPTYNLPSSSGS